MYLQEFKSVDDIVREYNIEPKVLEGCEILLAWYGYGSYCGASLVIFRHAGKLYEVNAAHCSCYGLEDQWDPEETTLEALTLRVKGMRDSWSEHDGESQAADELERLVQSLA